MIPRKFHLKIPFQIHGLQTGCRRTEGQFVPSGLQERLHINPLQIGRGAVGRSIGKIQRHSVELPIRSGLRFHIDHRLFRHKIQVDRNGKWQTGPQILIGGVVDMEMDAPGADRMIKHKGVRILDCSFPSRLQ